MSFTVTLALDAILAVTASFWSGRFLLGSNPEGVASAAMQQGGLGLFMTALIVSAPRWRPRSSRAPSASSPPI